MSELLASVSRLNVTLCGIFDELDRIADALEAISETLNSVMSAAWLK